MGVADSLAAIRAGCTQVQGTFNGLGERCGNANLTTIIGTLYTKYKIKSIPEKNIKKLMDASYYIAEISNSPVATNAGFIGHRAFTHKGGMHIDAVIKNPVAYEHVEPSTVGNKRNFVTSELAGKMPIVQKAQQLNIKLDKTGGLTEALALKQAAIDADLKIMVGCMLGTSLSMAPAMVAAQGAQIVDLDGPVLLEKDRPNGLKFADGIIYPPETSFWG